jgi:hypothetical protein
MIQSIGEHMNYGSYRKPELKVAHIRRASAAITITTVCCNGKSRAGRICMKKEKKTPQETD